MRHDARHGVGLRADTRAASTGRAHVATSSTALRWALAVNAETQRGWRDGLAICCSGARPPPTWGGDEATAASARGVRGSGAVAPEPVLAAGVARRTASRLG